MLTVALGMMLCLPLRLINYRDWALMGNDSQQSKPPCFWRLQRGIGDTCGTLWIPDLRFQIINNLCLTFVKLVYLMKHLPVCFVYSFFFLSYSSIVISEHWYHQHSWIWQHHPALEWRQEDVQRNRGVHEGQVRSHSHYHLVWQFYLKLLMVSQL